MEDAAEPRDAAVEEPAARQPKGRSLSDFPQLTAADSRLIEACRLGEECVLGASRPETVPGSDDVVDARIVRFLVLGGDASAPVHEKGVQLQGAWIAGALDLGDCTVVRPLALRQCRLEALYADDARLLALSLEGSRIEGALKGDRLRCAGILSLSNGFRADKGVSLSFGEIGGNFLCSDSELVAPSPAADAGENAAADYALAANGLVVSAGVYLDGGFRATGGVSLVGAAMSSLTCRGGTFDRPDGPALSGGYLRVSGAVDLNDLKAVGGVNLTGAAIGSDLVCELIQLKPNMNGVALDLDRAAVGGTLFFREVKAIEGILDLTLARVGALCDDEASWRLGGSLRLDGFTYGHIIGGPNDALMRIRWLGLQMPQHLGADFRPRPWEQLIEVLRTTGHPGEARRVAIAKHRHLLGAARQRFEPWPAPGARPARHYHWLADRVAWTFTWLYGALSGFGYAPVRVFLIMAAVWFTSALGYLWASSPGDGAAPRCTLFTAAKAPERPRAAGNESCGPTATFDPWLYSFDVLVPVDLGYQSTAKPSDRGAPTGVLNWLIAVETAVGWLGIGALIATAGNQLIRKD